MLLSVKGIFKDGVAQPVEVVEGREGEPVVITFVEDLSEQPVVDEEAAWDGLTQLVKDCEVETGIPDLAHQHDHYLYGKDKEA
jgi:hypothetical protein